MRHGLFVQRATQVLGTIVKSEQYSGELEDQVSVAGNSIFRVFVAFLFAFCTFYYFI